MAAKKTMPKKRRPFTARLHVYGGDGTLTPAQVDELSNWLYHLWVNVPGMARKGLLHYRYRATLYGSGRK